MIISVENGTIKINTTISDENQALLDVNNLVHRQNQIQEPLIEQNRLAQNKDKKADRG